MAKDTRTFTRGRMNKELDERLIPNGEYIDALNIRVGSTEEDDMGVVQSSLGNTQLTNIQVQGVSLSNDALCIGALEDPLMRHYIGLFMTLLLQAHLTQVSLTLSYPLTPTTRLLLIM